MGRYFFITLILLLQTCKQDDCDWKGGEIISLGSFCIKDELKIEVYERNNYLKYKVWDEKGKMLIEDDQNISIYQQWGFFLDNEKQLWVFSSDVGIFCWSKNDSTDTYRKKTFYYKIKKDSLPIELRNSKLMRFLR